MKKSIVFALMVLLGTVIFSITGHADIGPKPTADIKVVGIDEPYYFDVLIYYDTDISLVSGEDLQWALEQYYQEDYPLDVLNGYQDEDGFASRTLSYTGGAPAHLSKLDGEKDIFHIGYFHAPEVFKIAIVTEAGNLIVSDVIERQLFTSTMTYDLTGVDLTIDQTGAGRVVEHIPYVHMSISLVIRVILTVLIELIILSFVFKYKLKQSFILVAVTNIVTQTLMTMGIMAGFYFWGSFFGLIGMLILGELCVFVSEMIIYGIWLREYDRKKAVLYGFVANLVTFIITIFTIPLI